MRSEPDQVTAPGTGVAEPVAVVSVGCRLPGGIRDLAGLSRVLHQAEPVLQQVPADRWGPQFCDETMRRQGTTRSHVGAFLADIQRFDADFFGISPREAREMDPQQRVLLEVAWETLAGTGHPQDRWAGSSTGVFTGVLANDYLVLHSKTRGITGIDPFYATGKEFSFGAGRIAYSFDLQGPVMTITTACSSSLLAVHLACQSLRAGECDAALAGGVNLLVTPELTVFMSQVGAVSPTGRSVPFSASADGVVRGEGCALVLLKRLADAERDGDDIVAVINGSSVNHDGHSAGLTVPNAAAQARLVRQALRAAGVTPEEIGYVEAHATGTPLGDPIELAALDEVFGHRGTQADPLLVGSHKAVFGHLDSAAGILGLLKAITVVRDGLVPPQPPLGQLTPHFDWSGGGLRIATEASRLATAGGRPRRAGVSAFGLSGTNVHVVISQPPVTASGVDGGVRREPQNWAGDVHWLAGVEPGEQGSSSGARAVSPAPMTAAPRAVTPQHQVVEPAIASGRAPATDAAAVSVAPAPAADLTSIREGVHAAVRQVLGLSDAKPVPAQRPLLDQGLTSITAVELATLLSTTFGTPKDPTLVYLCPRVEDLINHFASLSTAGTPDTATPTGSAATGGAADAAPADSAPTDSAPTDSAPTDSATDAAHADSAANAAAALPAALSARSAATAAPAPIAGPAPAGPAGAEHPGSLAIVGMACRVPGAGSIEEFWQLICDGAVQVREIPGHRRERDGWSTVAAEVPSRAGYLDGVEGFDASYFKISPMEAERIDPQQRLFLEVASEALADAGIVIGAEITARTGVYVGMNTTDYQQRLTRSQSDVDVYFGTGNSFAGTPGRLAYALNLGGPCLSVDTACSSSLTAVHLASQALRSGECDAAVVGGVNVISGPTVSISMSRGGALAADGHCKTFSEAADGYGRGEGAGVIVLKRLDRALADGDQIYATVLGSALNSDGASGGFTVPNAAAQSAVVAAALSSARVRPADVGYVEAHGTGTPLGDPIELQALSKALRPDPDSAVYVGSVKSLIGHLEAAAGLVGLIKAALSIHRDQIPPHRLTGARTSRVSWQDLGIRLADQVTDWPRRQERLAGVSAFGFTGSNAHVILGQAPGQPEVACPPSGTGSETVLVLSADSPDALRQHAAQLVTVLADGAQLDDLAYTLARRRSTYRYRAVVLAEDSAGARHALLELAGGRPHPDVILGARAVTEPSAICYRFSAEAYLHADWAYLPDELRLAGNEAAAEIDSLTRKLLSDLSSTQRQRVATLRAQVGWSSVWRRLGLRQSYAIGEGVGAQAAAWARGEISLGVAVERALHAGQAEDLQAQHAAPAEDQDGSVVIDVVPSCVATAVWLWLQAHSFIAGYPTSWRGAIAETGRRICLPAYPWQRRDFWFTSSAVTQAAPSLASASTRDADGQDADAAETDQLDERLNPVRRLLFSHEWRPVELAASTRAAGGRWLIFAAPQAPLAQDLAAELKSRGQQVRLAGIPDSDPAQWTTALAAAAAEGAVNAVLIASEHPDAERLTIRFGQAVQRFPGSLGAAHLITRAAHPVDPETAPRPEQAAAWAVGAVLATELARRWGRLIDLAEPIASADVVTVAAALLSEQADDQLHLDGARCHARRIRRQLDAPDPKQQDFHPDLRFAVHGPDLSTVRPVLRWLADRGAGGALVHLNEPATTGEPADSALAVEQLTDEGSWLDRIDELAATGALGGLVYCAEHQDPPVMVRDCKPAELDDESAGELLSAAINRLGLNAPTAGAAAASDRAPGLVLLLTDAAGDWGALGAAESGARRARERAILRQHPALRHAARVLALLPREHPQAAAGASVLQADSGIGQLSPQQVMDVLDFAISAPAGAELSAGVVDVERYVSVCQRLAPRALLDELDTAGAGEGRQSAVLKELRALDPARRSHRLLDLVLSATASVLGLNAREVDPDTGFFDLGMDSIIAVSLKTRLENDTDTELPVTLTFELPTPRKVAKHLTTLLESSPDRPALEPTTDAKPTAFGWPGQSAVTAGAAEDTPADEATDDELLALLSQATASARTLLQEASPW